MSPSKKKILYVITKSNYGGAQRYVFDLATHLDPNEFDTVVAFGGTGDKGAQIGTLSQRLSDAHIRTIPIKHFMRDVSIFEDIQAFFELVRIIRTERPDVLHVTSSKAGGLGALAGRIACVPTIVFTSHGLTFDETWRPMWQRALIWLFTWCTILISTHTIQISRDTYERAAIMPFVRRRVVLIHNGIDTPNFIVRNDARATLVPQAVASAYRAQWIGTIAEYHPNKNLHALIEAVAQLRDRGIKAHLILIGEGEERERLATLAEKLNIEAQVHLTGYIQGAAHYLKALDIFTLPSKKEGLPYVLLEAGLAELPVVVSNITGNTEIVTDKKTGVVIDATREQLADAFEALLRDPDRMQSYARALHTHVADSFSIEQMVHDTLSLYRV
jgi:glycosyltransferase involved in cell wall biosynthesis